MRWEDKPIIQQGAERIVKLFLFLPKRIDGETRWLEFAKVKQKYIRNLRVEGKWEDIEWWE